MGIKQPKNNRIRIGLGDRRYDKLLEYASERDKTITSIIEDWIDEIPQSQLDNSVSSDNPWADNRWVGIA